MESPYCCIPFQSLTLHPSDYNRHLDNLQHVILINQGKFAGEVHASTQYNLKAYGNRNLKRYCHAILSNTLKIQRTLFGSWQRQNNGKTDLRISMYSAQSIRSYLLFWQQWSITRCERTSTFFSFCAVIQIKSFFVLFSCQCFT